MSASDHAKRAQEYLEDLCSRIDRGEAPARGNWVSRCAVPLVLGLTIGCSGEDVAVYSAPSDGPLYAAPPQEICDNGEDDNGDGLTDCADPQCAEFPGCETSLYAGPPEEICDNGEDDNGDGLADCDDPQCFEFPGCLALPYAAPEEICDNGVDDNGDGAIDCADPQCAEFPGCEMPMYAGPPE